MRKVGVARTNAELIQSITYYLAKAGKKYRDMLITEGLIESDGRITYNKYNNQSKEKLQDIVSAIKNEVRYELD